MNIPNGVKPYSCKVCKRTFSIKAGLNSHIFTHGKKPYQCKLCNKTFFQESNFIKHLLVHSQKANYMLSGLIKYYKEKHEAREMQRLCEACV